MKRFRVINLVSMGLLVLLLAIAATLAGATAPQQKNVGTATATPLAMATLVPPVVAADEGVLQELGEAVAVANQQVGASTSWRDHPAGDAALPVAVGEKLPGFGLVMLDGSTFRLDVADEPLLLNFWASWCGPCIEEFPLLIAADGDVAQPYRVAFVNVWDDAYTYEEFLGDYPGARQVMRDPNGAIANLYGLEFVPISIFIDETGEIILIQHGVVHEAVLELAAALLSIAE